MERVNVKRLYRNFGKNLINDNINIKKDRAFYYDSDTHCIGVPHTLEREEVENAILKYFEKKGIVGLSSYTLGFIHELGHYYSEKRRNFTIEDFRNFHFQASLITFRYNNGDYSYSELLEVYYEIENEKLANEFVFKIYKEKLEVIKRFDRLIKYIYEEKY
jgi:hypothetical protein